METEKEMIWSLLRAVIDPELGCNIVDLGLIYGVEVKEKTIHVTMTLTTPGCPMHQSIADGVVRMLSTIDGIDDVRVNVVWDPPWDPSRLSESARQQMGVR